MGDYLSPAQRTAVAAANLRLGIFFRMEETETEPALCLWSGIQNRDAGIPAPPAVVVNNYLGMGTLLDAPEIEHIVDGTANDVTFTMSALAPETEDFTLPAPPDVRGRLVQLALGFFDPAWQLIGDLLPIAIYTASHLTTKLVEGDGDSPSTWTVSLVTQLGDTSRSRGVPQFWSAPQWGKAHPGSTFTDFVARYQQGVTAAWPR